MNFSDYGEKGAIRLAERLVNTYNVIGDIERLTDLSALNHFLNSMGITPLNSLTGHDLERVKELRVELRKIFFLHDDSKIVELLNRILSDYNAVPYYTNHDGQPWHLHVTKTEDSVANQLGANAAMALLSLISKDGFARFRECEGKECKAVFVDLSRNALRRYCSAKVCGNRAHVASYRTRRRKLRNG